MGPCAQSGRTVPASPAGDWVLCDPTVRSRDDALTPDITLQGLSARGDGGLHLQKHFGEGSFAEQARSGLLELNHFDVTEFPLDDADRAVAHAADSNGRFTLTVIRP